jgi:hypothetical protein
MSAPLATTSSFGSTTPAVERPSRGTTALGALAGGALATAIALVVYAVANVGSPVRVITGWAPDGTDLGVPDVVITTVVSVLIAAVGLAILERFAANGLRAWTIAVAVVTVLSFLPLWRLDIDTGSKVALTFMHLAVGAAVVAGQRFVRRPVR